jgi:hypothetical protein
MSVIIQIKMGIYRLKILQQARFNVVQVKAWSISLTYAATKRDGFDAFHGNFVHEST